jgi:hypothetical protein
MVVRLRAAIRTRDWQAVKDMAQQLLDKRQS